MKGKRSPNLHSLLREQPSLAGIQVYGTDEEKVLTYGFKRNFQLAFGLHFFFCTFQEKHRGVIRKEIQ